MNAPTHPERLLPQLNEEVKSTGLFFPIDPGANPTLGGMSATRARDPQSIMNPAKIFTP